MLTQVAEQSLARLGFTHAVHPRLVPALLHPRRDHASQAGGTGVVCVHVRGDLQAVLLRLLNTPDQLVELVPIPPARRLEVINLRPNAGLACNGEQLVERLEQLRPLAAHMGDVQPVVFRNRLGQAYQFLRRGVVSRGINQRCADAHRALLHRGPGERLHPLQLGLGGRPVFVADLVHAQRGRADERCDVRRHAEPDEMLEPLAKRGPRHVRTVLAPAHGGVERAKRRALPEHLERDALPDVALRLTVAAQRFGRPAQHVDKTRRNRLAGGIDHCLAAQLRRRAQVRNPVAANGHRPDKRHAAAAVVNRPVLNDHIVPRPARAAPGACARHDQQTQAKRKQEVSEKFLQGHRQEIEPHYHGNASSLGQVVWPVRSVTAAAAMTSHWRAGYAQALQDVMGTLNRYRRI